MCQCHGKPTHWRKDSRKSAGGYWVCAVRRREAQERYDQSEKGIRRCSTKTIGQRIRRNRADQDTAKRILAENPWLEELDHGKTVGTEGRERAIA